ncbi:MAG: acyl carrier protein [Myxococcales bacterium FL481]|nr:MAG: acyl carrier protein [Myxococcales bacterium FL481]
MPLDADALLQFVRTSAKNDSIAIDTPLFSTGELDSVHQLNLIMLVETQAGITVSQGDVTLENFDSVQCVLDYVERASA